MEKRKNYFLMTAPFVGLLAVLALALPTQFTTFATTVSAFFFTMFDWYIIWIPLAVILIVGYLAFSKYGKIRLGGDEAKPEFSRFSWLAMLFTSGIGVGIVFFGPIEGIWELLYSNYAQLPYLTESQAASGAMSVAVWLWGVPAWAIYALAGLIIAYYAYQHKTDYSPSSAITTTFKNKKWSKPVATITSVLAIITIAITISSSLAMAAQQVNGGIGYIIGDVVDIKIFLLIGIFILFTIIAISPIKKGMKVLSDWTVILSVVVLVFIFLFGPTRYFLMVMVESIGSVITTTIPHSFNLYIHEGRYWMTWFAMSYWVWWITWTPFVGVFLAKISKGRTVKEFLVASTIVPAGFIIVWFSTLSGFGLLDTIAGTGTLAEVAGSAAYEGTVYQMMNLLPLGSITKVIVVILFSAFVITTAVSAAISLSILTSKDGKTAEKPKIIIWSSFMSAIAFAILVTGKIEGIKALGAFAGFPYMFFWFITIAALFVQLRRDKK